MTEQLVYFLLGLYFIGVSLPQVLLDRTVKAPMIQLILGIILVVLAVVRLQLLG